MRKLLLSPLLIRLFITSLILLIGEPFSLVKSQEISTSCQVKAYVIDRDPKGLNLRRSPSASSPIIGKLALHTEVKVFASRGSWLLVSPISPEITSTPKQGWVFAPLLGLQTKGYGQKTIPLYENPTEISRKVGQVTADTEVTLLGCAGTWVRIKTSQGEGWLEPTQQCASPYTTCS